MKEIMLPVRPKWCELIASGKKIIEARKTIPKCDVPFKVDIYCTKPSKKYQTVCGCMILNSDELFRLPTGKIKYGDSVEMMMYDNYTTDNFLNGKVIGEFVCYECYPIHVPTDIQFSIDTGLWSPFSERILHDACLTPEEVIDYAGNKEDIFGWRISDLIIYDKPKQLSEFWKANVVCHRGTQKNDCDGCWDCEITRPPQCFCYVERRRENDLSRLHSS